MDEIGRVLVLVVVVVFSFVLVGDGPELMVEAELFPFLCCFGTN